METIGKPMSGTNEAIRTVGRTVDHTEGSVHQAIDKAADVLRPAVDDIAAGAHLSVDRIASAATVAAETVSATAGQLLDTQSRFTESCRVQVREKPITSLGIAVAVGFLLSLLLRRR
jgi:ElaB/YqjD/DUF883 family membrane-anchored ribosome-binding protein